jgi:hypothetical protein
MALSLVKIKKDRLSAKSSLTPTEFIAAGVNKSLNTVIIHSLKGSEVVIAVNVALTRWMLDGNVIETWRALCNAADALNADLKTGHPLETVCHCDVNDADFCFHPCDICLMLTRCIDLRSYKGLGITLRICASCFNKYETEVATRPKSKKLVTGTANLRRNLQRLVRFETRGGRVLRLRYTVQKCTRDFPIR